MKNTSCFIAFLIFFSCNSDEKSESINPVFSDTLSVEMNQTVMVSDSARRIMDELNLCEKIILQDQCYDSSNSKLLSLKSDSTYDCFIFITDGGSGGQTIEVYERRLGKYQEINDFFAFCDLLPGTITNEHYDILLSHRDYDRGMIQALYKWDGKKYAHSKFISVNGIPLDLLIEIGITDKNGLTPDYPYVKETEDYNQFIYGTLYMDTLEISKNHMILQITKSDNLQYGYDKIWKVEFAEDRYVTLE